MKQIIPVGGPKPAPEPHTDMAVQNALQYAHEAAVFAHRAIDDALRTALKQALEAGKFRCAECGRAFKTPSEFRYNAKHKPACRTRCGEAK